LTLRTNGGVANLGRVSASDDQSISMVAVSEAARARAVDFTLDSVAQLSGRVIEVDTGAGIGTIRFEETVDNIDDSSLAMNAVA